MATATAMKESLTPEEEAHIDVVAHQWISLLHRGDGLEPESPEIQSGLELIYSSYEMKVPDVEVIDSPPAALRRAKELGADSPNYDWCGISDSGWLSFYDYFDQIKVLRDDEPETKQFRVYRDFVKGGVYDCIFFDERALLIRMPNLVKLDQDGNLHANDGPAISWRDGYQEYSWHGVFVPERLIMDPGSYTMDQVLELPTEERRALGEHLGWDKFAELVGAKPVNAWQDPNTGLSYELLTYADERKLLKKQSPKLQNGEQPFYIEPVNRELRTAQAARKWQAVRNLSVEDCERDPVLVYGVEA